MPVAGSSSPRQRRAVSPLARRLAREAGIDLDGIAGTGPEGRIVKRDVELARAAGATPGAPEGPARRMLDQGVPAAPTPHAPLRIEMADRIGLAQRTVPQLVLGIDCRLDALLAARRADERTAASEPGAGAISLTALLVRALGLALADVPAANVSWCEAGVLHPAHSDIAVSVAVEGGWRAPVLRQAEAKSASLIARELRDLALRARSGRLEPEHYAGGASTIHNLGMHAIARMIPIVEPPRATCLAVGAAELRPIVAEGQIAVATVMSCTLAADLRVVDGVVAATLLARLKALIEDPGPIMA
ncbi:MAG: 2-oxo acid dehydrogenase subunit E2 [Pseudomonadota bacterium]